MSNSIRVSLLTTVEEQENGKKTLLAPLAVYEFTPEQRQEFHHWYNQPEVTAIVAEAQAKLAEKLIEWGDSKLASQRQT